MQYLSILLPLLLSVVLATYIIPRILVVSVKKDLVVPSETRDKGRLRVPRLGGVSLFPILVISVGATMVCLVKFHILPLIAYEDSDTFVYYMFGIAGLTMMYLLGVMDDLLGVSLTSRLVIEVLAAALIPLSGLWLDDLHGILGIFEVPWWFGIPMTIFTIIYISNAITMLDDVDGLAAGTAMIAFAVLGFLALYVQEYLLLMICATMIGMLIPFFYRNVMERRMSWRNIYLGGTGGLVIGYVLSFVVIALSRMGHVPARGNYHGVLRHPHHPDVRCVACVCHSYGQPPQYLPARQQSYPPPSDSGWHESHAGVGHHPRGVGLLHPVQCRWRLGWVEPLHPPGDRCVLLAHPPGGDQLLQE